MESHATAARGTILLLAANNCWAGSRAWITHLFILALAAGLDCRLRLAAKLPWITLYYSAQIESLHLEWTSSLRRIVMSSISSFASVRLDR